MSNHDSENVVRKSIVVALDVKRAFRVWTEQINTWWPASHSISGDPKTRVFIEGKVGGRFYECTSNGVEYDWGMVEVWEPPYQLAFRWYLGNGPELPTRVEIHFVPLDKTTTRIELEHHGSDLIGELWWFNKAKYSMSWETILPQYAAACNPG